MDNPIILHVNYVEQGQSVQEMCEVAVRLGYEGIEFRSKRGGVEETAEEYLDQIAAGQKKTGMKYVIFGGPGPDLMNTDADVRRRATDEYLAFYRLAASRFELTVCNTMTGWLGGADAEGYMFDKHGSAAATDEHWAWAAEGLGVLGDCAGELGFRLALEVHMGYLHDHADTARKLVDMVGRSSVGINMDYGNEIWFPKSMPLKESLAIAGDKLYQVHLKNALQLLNREYNKCIPCSLADGVINHREYIGELRAMGFDGPLTLEAPRPGDRVLFAEQDIAYLRSLLGGSD